GRLERLLQAVALGVILPAVVRAADAAVLHEAVGQRRAAVRTVLGDAAVGAALVAEEHELLVHDLHAPGGVLVRELADKARWVPVAAQQLAHRRAGSYSGEQLVLFLR